MVSDSPRSVMTQSLLYQLDPLDSRRDDVFMTTLSLWTLSA